METRTEGAHLSTPNERLRAARIAAGFNTARDAAKANGWVEPTYRGHESGPRQVSRTAAIAYAKAFKVSLSWLLTGREDEGGNVDVEVPLRRRRRVALNELAAVIEAVYGPRCARSEGGCATCGVWTVFDALTQMTDVTE